MRWYNDGSRACSNQALRSHQTPSQSRSVDELFQSVSKAPPSGNMAPRLPSQVLRAWSTLLVGHIIAKAFCLVAHPHTLQRSRTIPTSLSYFFHRHSPRISKVFLGIVLRSQQDCCELVSSCFEVEQSGFGGLMFWRMLPCRRTCLYCLLWMLAHRQFL
jgi:hypothetical protein